MKKTTQLLMAGLLFAGLVAGCAQAPQQELEAAQAALAQADSAEADVYVADVYAAAQDSLAAAQAALDAQRFDEAKRLLEATTQLANEAIAQVEPRKEGYRAETEALLAQARQAVDALKATAPTTPTTGVSLTENVATLEATLGQAQDALAAGDVVQARTLAQQVLDQAGTTPPPADAPADTTATPPQG